MRVNSAHRAIFIALLLGFSVASSFAKSVGDDLPTKKVNLIIRQIGHRLLLTAGDSTSRVLPVTEIEDGTYLLKFENEFSFSHDSLIALSQDLLPKYQFPSGYTVTVHEGEQHDIVYGFQFNNTSPDIVACQGRSEPIGRYTIEIDFPDFYKKPEPKKSIELMEPEPVKTVPLDVALKPGAFKMPTFRSKSLIKTRPAESNLLVSLIFSGVLMLLGVGLLIRRPVPLKTQRYPALGKFLFDAKDHRLLLGDEVIVLTDKECRILELLNDHFGELVLRETLMQKIWLDEGIITGRSLDMFVSKLRKKLSGDPGLSITNVHGKGYKLGISSI